MMFDSSSKCRSKERKSKSRMGSKTCHAHCSVSHSAENTHPTLLKLSIPEDLDSGREFPNSNTLSSVLGLQGRERGRSQCGSTRLEHSTSSRHSRLREQGKS